MARNDSAGKKIIVKNVSQQCHVIAKKKAALNPLHWEIIYIFISLYMGRERRDYS